MTERALSPDRRYAALVSAFAGRASVSQEGKGFGSTALKTRGRIFAMLARDRLVVKLPARRVEELVAAREGERFDPRGDGRTMKEWLSLDPSSGRDWQQLAEEALEFVSAKA
jgi:hypothetical protein